jgi:AraC-like DNA-binding protein
MRRQNPEYDHLFQCKGSFGTVWLCKTDVEEYDILNFHAEIQERDTKVLIDHREDFLGLYFNLRNDFTSPADMPMKAIPKNQFNLVYLPKLHCEYNLDKGTYAAVAIRFSPGILKIWTDEYPQFFEFFRKVEGCTPAVMSRMHLHILPEVHTLIRDILHNTYTGFTKQTFLKARIFDVFKYCFEQFAQGNDLLNISLSAADLKKVEAARDYILANMQHPLSISLLAHRVNIDDFKLTKGFKLCYGRTIHNYLMEERMKRACVLLRDTDMPVTRIANEIGYRKLSNFSDAFKKKFGYSPREERHGDTPQT